jgi:hypothetical protein
LENKQGGGSSAGRVAGGNSLFEDFKCLKKDEEGSFDWQRKESTASSQQPPSTTDSREIVKEKDYRVLTPKASPPRDSISTTCSTSSLQTFFTTEWKPHDPTKSI